ncbi:MAG: STN domain-containing protein, partial [Pirellulales bacterium]
VSDEVKQQLAKMRDGENVAAQSEGKLEVKRFSSEQAAPPKAVPLAAATLAAAAPSEPVPPPVGDVNDGEGRLLADVEQHNRLITELLRAQVENELRQARAQMSTNPQGTEQSLKLMFERVVRSPELKAEVRAQLRGQLEATLREAARRGATKDILDQQREEARGADRDRAQIAEGLMRDQEKVVQLMERFNSLMAEGRYVAADQIGEMEVARIAPNLPIAQSASLTAHMTGAHQADLALRMARQKAVVDTLATVEVSLMPFPDDQPVIYPPADVWEEIYYRRKKYAESDLKAVSPAEAKIQKALSEPTKIEVIETPLQEVVTYLKDLHGIEIQLDRTAMADAGADPEEIVTLSVNGISLKSALRLLLRGMDLTYIIRDEVLLITTKDVADAALVPKAYPVGDLVIPVQSMGGGMMGMMGRQPPMPKGDVT